MIIFGLFTRFFAAALAVEFAIITFVAHWPVGFAAGRGRLAIATFLGPHAVRRCGSRWGAVLARP